MLQSNPHHSFDILLATQYGVHEAILIHHFQHWIGVNKRLKRNFHDGRTWTYQTLEEIASHFPYFTKDQVRDLIEKLCTGKSRYTEKEIEFEPILIKGNYNKKKFDRTTWYAFKNEKMFTMWGNPKIEDEDSPNGKGEITTPIPDTKPNTKPNTKSNAPTLTLPLKSKPSEDFAAAANEKEIATEDLEIKNTRGERIKISSSEIFRHFLKSDFSTELIMQAIDIARNEPNPINSPLKFLESVCFRLQNSCKTFKLNGVEKKEYGQDIPINHEPAINYFELLKKRSKDEI